MRVTPFKATEGFFDQFRVTFDRRAGVFELDPYAADVH
jgi:hypothetical protein